MERTVATEFTARDAGYTAVVQRMSAAFEANSHRLEGLRERFGETRREIGLSTIGVLGIGAGIGAWVEKAKEAQGEFARTEKGIAGILAGSLNFSRGTTEIERYNRSLVLSRGITEDLEHLSGRFVTTLDDASATYRTVAISAGGLGLSQRQVMELTEEAAATAKRFGVAGETAAISIARALQTGSVRGFDPFNIRLRESLGNMKKLTEAQRFAHIEKALKGSVEIADAMSGGVGGALARIQHTVEGLIRDVTRPVFREVARTLEGWAKHIREARENGRSMVDSFGGQLASGFKTLVELSEKVLAHWKEIAVIWAAFQGAKLARGLGGMLGAAGGALGAGGGLGAIGGALGSLGGALGTFGRVVPALGAVAGAAGLAAIALKDVYDEWQGRKRQAAELGGFFEEMGKVARAERDVKKFQTRMGAGELDQGRQFAQEHAQAAADILKAKGLMDESGHVTERFGQVMDSMSEDVRARFAGQFKGMLGDVSSGMLGAFAQEVLGRNYNADARAVGNEDLKLKNNKVNLNILGGVHITQKFEDSDPDRVFIRFRQDLEEHVDRRLQGFDAEGQGH